LTGYSFVLWDPNYGAPILGLLFGCLLLLLHDFHPLLSNFWKDISKFFGAATVLDFA
jgi:hypothetical protein